MSPIFKRNKNRSDSENPEVAAETTTAAVPEDTFFGDQDEAAEEPAPAAEPEVEDDVIAAAADSVRYSRPELVSVAFASWHAELKELADRAARPFSPVDPAVVDLSAMHPTGRANLYTGMPTLISSMVREETALKVARSHQATLRKRIAELTEQYGYAPVTLATGEVTWQEWPEEAWNGVGGAQEPEVADTADEKSEETPQVEAPQITPKVVVAPALLRTVRLDPAGDDDVYVTLTAKCEVNPVFIRALESSGISPDDVVRLRTLAANWESEEPALQEIIEAGRAYLPGFSYESRVLLGSFVHPGQVLLADLESMRPYIESSGVMAALAGDEETRQLSVADLPPTNPFDREPEAERGVGDRDVDELAVVEAVASGRSVAIDAPPGSERVGTLAAIVADATASGRSVLYVPGRASSGKALLSELDSLDLGGLLLDFADLDNVAMRLRTGLRQKMPDTDDDAALQLRGRLAQTRRQLTDYIDALHTVDPTWQLSVYGIIQRLAGLTAGPDAPSSRVRLGEDALTHLQQSSADVQALLAEAADLGAFLPVEQGGSWTGARIQTVAEGEKALALAKRIGSELLPVVMAQSQRAAGETGLSRAVALDDWLEQIAMLDGIAETLDVFLPQVYERSVADMIIATATKEWREKHGEQMKRSERHRLTKQAGDMVRPGATASSMHTELVRVERQREVWRRYCSEGGWPKLPGGMAQIRATAREIESEIRELEAYLPAEINLGAMPMENLLAYLRQLAEGEEAMGNLPRRNEVVGYLTSIGLGPFMEDLLARNIPAEAVNGELELVYLSSVFEQIIVRNPGLATIGPADLANLSNDLRYLDLEHTRTLAWPVRRAVVHIMRETISKRRDDTMALDTELDQYSTGALRDVIANYSRLVQVARPAWAIPSMMAAEFIPPMPWADLVIMDEMDAVPLSSVLSVLMRGRQIVVMGDIRRASEGAAIKEFAKVLPVRALPTLRARYDDLATQTLCEQGYADVIEMVPSVARNDRAESVRLVTVDGRGVPSPTTGTVDSTTVEVEAVVDAVINHALTQPEMSLAVICVSEPHALRVREAVNKAVEQSTVLGVLTDKSLAEPFIVLDMTQVGGLRRDAVILSVGFGKTVHGRVLHSFGNLSEPSGVNALVDAIEAAREEMTIVSALGPREIAVENLTAPGPRLLAKLIDRAAGVDLGLRPAGSETSGEPLLADLAARLAVAGWQTQADYGFESGVRIPLVVGHASFRGVWRVAILFDDDAYVGEPSLRRRDRYWAERLEARGWIVFQTFSTSLFIDPAGQAEAVIALLSQARAAVLGEADVALQPMSVPSLHDSSYSVGRGAAPEVFIDPAPSMRITRVRGPRPLITAGLPLAAYTDDQLDEMVEWITSDGGIRSEEELVLALRDELNIRRRGAQVDAVLMNVVRRVVSAATTAPAAETLEARMTGEFSAIRDKDEQ